MVFNQRTTCNRGTEDGLGWCLRFTQSAFNAPVAYPSARSAWDGQKGRHVGERPPKGVAVPIWFDHWGSYGSPASWGNWGHVAVSLPDGRVFTSPMYASQLSHWDAGKGTMVGSAIYPSIEALQKVIGGSPTYLGWSEYLNGKQIVSPVTIPVPTPEQGQEEDEDMAQAHSMESPIDGTVVQAVYDTDGFYTEWIGGNASYNANIRKMFGVTSLHCSVTKSHFNAIKASVLAKSESSVTVITADVPILPEKE